MKETKFQKPPQEYPKVDPTKQFLAAFELLSQNNDDPNLLNKIYVEQQWKT